jgi:hypothetical protein
MAAAAREYFTVDLRGLRAALGARAAEKGLTESDVVRGALAAALDGPGGSTTTPAPFVTNDGVAPTSKVNLSVRLTRAAALRLDSNARAAGLSRGAYLMRLIDGAPSVAASADRKAAAAALSRSSAELAVLSRDLHHLTQLLRRGAVEAARQYYERLESADADVRAHLDKATLVLAHLSAAPIGPRHLAPAASPRSTS